MLYSSIVFLKFDQILSLVLMSKIEQSLSRLEDHGTKKKKDN